MSIRKLAAIIGLIGTILAFTACGGADKDDINQTKVPDITTQDEADDRETEQTESQGTDDTDDVDSSADDDLAEAETRAKQLEEKLQNESLTQQEMNQISAELYALWDEKLNEVWEELKDELPEAEMKELTEEERVWIANKEKQIAEAGAECEGGSLQALQENTEGAELTRARVYELVKRLK